MNATARDFNSQSADTNGLEDIFDVEAQGVTEAYSGGNEGVTGRIPESAELLTLAEAARRLEVPYTTFYKQVKTGKHETVLGSDGKPRVVFRSVTPGVTENDLGVTEISQGVTEVVEGVTGTIQGETEAKHLEVLQQFMLKLEAANYRIGWLESQLSERETDVQELKLLVDSQRKPGWWTKFSNWFFKAQ